MQSSCKRRQFALGFRIARRWRSDFRRRSGHSTVGLARHSLGFLGFFLRVFSSSALRGWLCEGNASIAEQKRNTQAEHSSQHKKPGRRMVVEAKIHAKTY